MARSKKKNIVSSPRGRVYIQSTFNNTIITVTDQSGNVLSWASAGSTGFKGTKKATPFAAQSAVKKALDGALPYNVQSVMIFVSGIGLGRDAAFRALSASGLEVTSIKDITPIPHNGVRPKKPRRV